MKPIHRSALSTTRRRTAVAVRIAGAMAALALVSVALVAVMPAPPAAAAVSLQCNGVFNAGGQGLDCEVTVENFLDVATGIASSRVTTLACSGPGANVDPLPNCVGPTVTNFTELTTEANQCNGSANGGGASLLCSITVINTITGAVTTAAAPINQCVGSYVGTGRVCDPDPATADASVDGVTQCNGTGNDASAELTCTVTASTTSSNSAFNFLANQCNGSSNEGGARTVCTVTMSTVVLPAGPGDNGGGNGGDTLADTGADAGFTSAIAALLLLAGAAALVVSRRRSMSNAR